MHQSQRRDCYHCSEKIMRTRLFSTHCFVRGPESTAAESAVSRQLAVSSTGISVPSQPLPAVQRLVALHPPHGKPSDHVVGGRSSADELAVCQLAASWPKRARPSFRQCTHVEESDACGIRRCLAHGPEAEDSIGWRATATRRPRAVADDPGEGWPACVLLPGLLADYGHDLLVVAE